MAQIEAATVPGSLAGALVGLDVASLGYDDVTAALTAVSRVANWTDGLRARLLCRLEQAAAEDIPTGSADELSRTQREMAASIAVMEAATTLRLPEGTAGNLLDEATELTGAYADTLALMDSGDLSHTQAAVILDQGRGLSAEQRGEFEAKVLDKAPILTRPQIRDRAYRIRTRMQACTLAARRTKAMADRRVSVEPADDAMAWFSALLPAEAARAAYNRITTAARTLRSPTEARTIDQRRADVLTDLLINPTATTEPTTGAGADAGRLVAEGITAGTGAGAGDTTEPTAGAGVGEDLDYSKIKAEVFVTVPVYSLMGLTDEPGFLEGYGPIPADVARKITASAPSFYRVLTDPHTGARLSVGRTAYRPPADIARSVRLAHPTCTFAGCRTLARHSELDHVRDWAKGGTTGVDGLRPECGRHHWAKHRTGWCSRVLPDGSVEWKSPAGKIYITRADDVDPPPELPPELVAELQAELQAHPPDHPPADPLADLTASGRDFLAAEPADDTGAELTNRPEPPPPF